MRRIIVFLMMSWLVGAGALAQEMTDARPGIAVAAPQKADGMVFLYAQPDEKSDVLMGYHRGMTLEVLRLDANDMVRVQSGTPGAGITGYMKRDDLRYGEMAMRELSPYVMNLRMRRGAAVYAYPDERSEVIGRMEEGDAAAVKGVSPEGWVQIDDSEKLFYRTGGWQSRASSGFIRLESGMALATFEADPYSWYILPSEGEKTAEQALELAKEYVMGFDEADTRIPARVRTREMLDAMRTDVRLIYSEAFKTPQWDVYMETEDAQYGFSVYLTIDGKLVRFEESNG